MKIRIDYVTNSSSSSFTQIHIDNPLYVAILEKYREIFENSGFEFSGEVDGKPTTIDFLDPESGFYFDVPKKLSDVALEMIDALIDSDIFEMDEEEAEAMRSDLASQVKSQLDDINRNYKNVNISYGSAGWDEGEDDSNIGYTLTWDGVKESYSEDKAEFFADGYSEDDEYDDI